MRLRTELESALASAVRELPDTELEIVTRVATRLVKGHQTYGEIAQKIGHPAWDWKGEAAQEAWDALVYFTAWTMQHD